MSLFVFIKINAQEKIVLDKIAAIIGNGIIKQSEIQNQMYQMKLEGYKADDETKCQLFESALIQKLFVDQSKIGQH